MSEREEFKALSGSSKKAGRPMGFNNELVDRLDQSHAHRLSSSSDSTHDLDDLVSHLVLRSHRCVGFDRDDDYQQHSRSTAAQAGVVDPTLDG